MSTQLPVLDGNRYAQPKEQYVVVNSEYEKHNAEDEIDLRELFLVLRRRKGTILLTTLVIFIIGFFVTLKIQPTYKATATIQIDSEDSAKVLNFDVGITGDSGNSEFFQTQYELLKSRALASKVIKELKLDEKKQPSDEAPTITAIILDKARDLVTWGDDDRPDYQLGSYPVESKFNTGLSITPVKKSQIVAIGYESKDPQFATDAANAVAENFIVMTKERRMKASESAQKFVEKELKEAKAALEKAEQELADYAKKASIIQTGDENSQSLLSQVTTELNLASAQAEASRIEAEALFRQVQGSQGASNALNSPAVQQHKSNLAQLQHDYDQNLQTYKPGHPKMRTLERGIRQAKQRLNREITANLSATRNLLESKYEAAKKMEKELKSKLDIQKAGLLNQRDKGIQYQSLLQKVIIKRKVNEGLLLRATEIKIASGVVTSNIAIVDPAILPYAAQKPNIKLNLALSSVLGLFMGVVIAFLLEFMDDRVKSSEELKRILGLAILGITPEVKGKDPIVHSLATAKQPTSALAEAFRSLRTNLLFSSVEGVPKVVALTSAMPSEGKSSSCINLAAAFAQASNSVLIVDADMRKPTVHKRLKLDNSQGLSNYLTRQSEMGDVIQETIIEGVSAITAGPLSPNPSELLSGPRIEDVFKLAPHQFDIVILDCPPVMGLADALVLANKANATILVSAFGQTSKRAIQDAHERLKQARANLIGAVFTKVKSGGGYGYSYEYSTYYSYGQRLEGES